MTMTPGEIVHKVRQLDNDVHDIYTLLTGIVATQTRHGNRLDELQQMVEGVRGQISDLSARVDGLNESMAEVLRRLPG